MNVLAHYANRGRFSYFLVGKFILFPSHKIFNFFKYVVKKILQFCWNVLRKLNKLLKV